MASHPDSTKREANVRIKEKGATRMSTELNRTDPEPAERKPMPARERSRAMLAIVRDLRRLAGQTDIHAHAIRNELNERLDALRKS
ncbi:MAG: hypothetical protein WBV94_24785 [Blastocatellia bacterium]